MGSADRGGKTLLVLVRRPPLGSSKGTEALRMAVGQTLSNRVTVALVGEGVWLAARLQPAVIGGGDVAKHLAMLQRLKQRVWVEEESLSDQGLDPFELSAGIQVVNREAIDGVLLDSDAVVVY